MFPHYFMPIFHLVEEVLKAIIHLMKYHSWVHGIVYSSQTNSSNFLSHNSMFTPSPRLTMILAISSCKQTKGLIHGLGGRTFKHINIVLINILIHGCKPPNVNNVDLINLNLKLVDVTPFQTLGSKENQ
jgi:hypothetical protein